MSDRSRNIYIKDKCEYNHHQGLRAENLKPISDPSDNLVSQHQTSQISLLPTSIDGGGKSIKEIIVSTSDKSQTHYHSFSDSSKKIRFINKYNVWLVVLSIVIHGLVLSIMTIADDPIKIDLNQLDFSRYNTDSPSNSVKDDIDINNKDNIDVKIIDYFNSSPKDDHQQIKNSILSNQDNTTNQQTIIDRKYLKDLNSKDSFNSSTNPQELNRSDVFKHTAKKHQDKKPPSSDIDKTDQKVGDQFRQFGQNNKNSITKPMKNPHITSSSSQILSKASASEDLPNPSSLMRPIVKKNHNPKDIKSSFKNTPGISRSIDNPRNQYEKFLSQSSDVVSAYYQQSNKDRQAAYVNDSSIMLGGNINLNSSQFKFMGYFAKIKEAIQYTWDYPLQAKINRLSGEVGIEFAIDKSGSLQKIYVTSSSGYSILDQEVVDAIKLSQPFDPMSKQMYYLLNQADKLLYINAKFSYIISR